MATGNEPPLPASDQPTQDAGQPATPPPLVGQHRPRDGHGHFERSTATVTRDAQAAALRAEGWKLKDIAAELGFNDRSAASKAIRRALRGIVQGPADKLIAHEAERLDSLYEEALEVLLRDHVTVSHGKVIKDDDGNVLLDDGPKLAAIDRLVKVRESYRKLLGLDQPAKVAVSGSVKYEVVGVDPEDLK